MRKIGSGAWTEPVINPAVELPTLQENLPHGSCKEMLKGCKEHGGRQYVWHKHHRKLDEIAQELESKLVKQLQNFCMPMSQVQPALFLPAPVQPVQANERKCSQYKLPLLAQGRSLN